MSQWSQESFHAAREFLRQAIAIDPENARAIGSSPGLPYLV